MDENRTKVLRNGAIYDTVDKRIIGRDPEKAIVDTRINSNNAIAMQSKRMEAKRSALAAGAMRALEKSGRVVSGDLAFVEAIGEALIESATDPSNRQQVRAAELLIRETGLSERTEQPAGGGIGHAADLITALAQFAAAITGTPEAAGEVIDGNAFDNYNYRNHSAEDTDAGSPAAGALPSTGTGQPDTGGTG